MASREIWTTLLLLATIYSASVTSRTPSHTDQTRKDHTLSKKSTAIDLLGDLEDKISILLKENEVVLVEDRGETLPPRERTLSRRLSRLEEAIVKLFDTSCFSRDQYCLERSTNGLWPTQVGNVEDRVRRLADYLVLALAWDCDDLYRGGLHRTGVYYFSRHRKRMYCDMTEVDGAWTVLLRRGPPTEVNFHDDWVAYTYGFGDLNAEFWLGNAYAQSITSLRRNELRVTMTDFRGGDYYALYDHFALNTSYYQLIIGSYQGNATDAMADSEGMGFTTYDMDNDGGTGNCAKSWTGGWWYKSCYRAHLTGLHVLAPNASNFNLIQWMRSETDVSQTLLPVRADMKFRPMHFVARSNFQKLDTYKPKYSGSLFVPVVEPNLL